MLPILSTVLPIIGQALDKVFPNAEERAKAEAALQAELIAKEREFQKAAAEIVRQEAASENWLAASWRPLVMLTFTGLLVARWLGFTAPGLSEREVIALWNIVEVGLGGYVIGHTVEKIAPSIATALQRR